MMLARHWLVPLFLLFMGFTGWLGWRYTSPVTVEISSTVLNLPFEVETIPSVVEAVPGEMVRVIYRVKNNSLTGLEAYATITIEPDQDSKQLEVFLSQCTGLNTFQNNLPEEYEVLFRVEPAGLTGSQHLVLRHTFESATARYQEIDQ
ncbi:MAG: cytochrome c oxidase assembly protein [Chloroflexi bacterium]|nr:cytochrome c oxidase assembly protein [Chloroflexota bacterium]